MATKKTAAKKSAAKPKAEKKESQDSSLEEVAKEVLEGKWTSGRERDILLTEAGYDPRAVQTEVARLRSQT